jgi:hypothetical protein
MLLSAADVNTFADYLNHPNSIAQPCVKKLIEKRTANAFCDFILEIVELFQLQSREEIVIGSLVLGLIFAPQFWVEARADGPGTADLEEIGLALDLFGCATPVEFLLRIGGQCAEPDDIRRSVGAAIAALRALTGAWREICTFAYEATAAEYLSAMLNSVRFALGEAIGSKADDC